MMNPDHDTLTWCRRILLRENTPVDQQKADACLHAIMNYRADQPEY